MYVCIYIYMYTIDYNGIHLHSVNVQFSYTNIWYLSDFFLRQCAKRLRKPIIQRSANVHGMLHSVLGSTAAANGISSIGCFLMNITGWWLTYPLKNMTVNWDYYSKYMDK